ncbi:MAG: S41 family peptidase [Gammaproteobacteria bacterium]|nr:S41 family peptidase [Gammaproteobacteria bacterium]
MIQTGRRLIGLLLLVSAVAIADEPETSLSETQLSLDDMRTFTDVFNQVRTNFVEESDDHTLLNAAIRGMLSELDPHSSYMEADVYRQMENDSQGRYSGIGVEVTTQKKQINVVFVVKGGPADKAGVTKGDIITAIDQKDVRGKNLQAAIDSLRGEVGSEVEVTFKHENGEVSSFLLKRDFVKVASVFSRPVDEDYGYFQITHFTRNSANELLEQVEYMQANHEGPLKGIVLDIRNNPGGVLEPAVLIADGFLDDGLIVYTRGRAANQLEYTAKPGQWLDDIPIVVLVDRGSASAAEVLAGALQDHGRALIVGERTFGKGSVQSVLSLRNGAGMRLTTSRYYTPSGRSIQAEGIQPDVEVSTVKIVENEDKRTRESDLDHHLDAEPERASVVFGSEVGAADDYMMYQALILLKGASILSNTDDRREAR